MTPRELLLQMADENARAATASDAKARMGDQQAELAHAPPNARESSRTRAARAREDAAHYRAREAALRAGAQALGNG